MLRGKLQVGQVTLDMGVRSLTDRLGRQQLLSYKSAQLMHDLACRAGEMVDRMELIESLWGKNYTVGSIRLYDEIWKIRHALEQLGVEDVRILTIPRRGYCLVIDPQADIADVPPRDLNLPANVLPQDVLAAWLLTLPSAVMSLVKLLQQHGVLQQVGNIEDLSTLLPQPTSSANDDHAQGGAEAQQISMTVEMSKLYAQLVRNSLRERSEAPPVPMAVSLRGSKSTARQRKGRSAP